VRHGLVHVASDTLVQYRREWAGLLLGDRRGQSPSITARSRGRWAPSAVR
jgi:hypothetical protein